jgi:2-isopropylmalate synthase
VLNSDWWWNPNATDKGGVHVSAVLKSPDTYETINPELVGNKRRTLVSELSGRGNIMSTAKELGFDMSGNEAWKDRAMTVLEQVKELENVGYSFEGAEASVELMLRRAMDGYRPPWELIDFTVLTGNKRVHLSADALQPSVNESVTQATVKLGLLGPQDGSNMAMCPTKVVLECGEGNGPVDAFSAALNRVLIASYPALGSIRLVDYKVRILDPKAATGATTRVMVEFHNEDTGKNWTTVCAHPNIIVASVTALMDGFEFAMLHTLPQCFL